MTHPLLSSECWDGLIVQGLSPPTTTKTPSQARFNPPTENSFDRQETQSHHSCEQPNLTVDTLLQTENKNDFLFPISELLKFREVGVGQKIDRKAAGLRIWIDLGSISSINELKGGGVPQNLKVCDNSKFALQIWRIDKILSQRKNYANFRYHSSALNKFKTNKMKVRKQCQDVKQWNYVRNKDKQHMANNYFIEKYNKEGTGNKIDRKKRKRKNKVKLEQRPPPRRGTAGTPCPPPWGNTPEFPLGKTLEVRFQGSAGIPYPEFPLDDPWKSASSEFTSEKP